MFQIDKNNHIRMSKGETATLTVPLFNPDKTPYTMSESGSDTLKLTLKKENNSSPVVTLPSSTNTIIINHNDTVNLQAGIYKYDILLTTGDGSYFYITEPEIFEIVDVVGSW